MVKSITTEMLYSKLVRACPQKMQIKLTIRKVMQKKMGKYFLISAFSVNNFVFFWQKFSFWCRHFSFKLKLCLQTNNIYSLMKAIQAFCISFAKNKFLFSLDPKVTSEVRDQWRSKVLLTK